jgi:phage gpG-like protein
MKSKRFDFSIVQAKLKEAKQHMPDELANMSLRYFQKSFKQQGFEDNTFNKWKERKNHDRSRSILVKSGKLRRSILIKQKSFSKIVIGSYLPYSAIHNEGFNGIQKVTSKTGKVFTRHMIMPKRQFMGNSARLRRMQEDKILKMIKRAFK